MCRYLGRSIRRIATDRRGNFGILAALCAVPLLLITGGAVDLGFAEMRRSQVQDAADAAALAAAKQYPINSDPKILADVAQTFFAANAGNLFRTKATLVFDGVNWTENHSRQVSLHAEYAYDPIFIPKALQGFAGFGSTMLSIRSAVLVSDTTVEIAMVLDTSGSMGDSPVAGGQAKIKTLRSVAADAAKAFFAGASTGTEKPTQIAVVPFSGAVNVGPQYLDAAWMDPKGLSPVHHENFDWKTYTDASGAPLAVKNSDKTWSLASDSRTKLTRQYLYKTMRSTSVVIDKSLCTYKGVTYPGCTWTQGSTGWTMKVGVLLPICTSAKDRTCQPIRISYGAPLYNFDGCVETRTGSAGITDVAPVESQPETLFVPWFAPDEPDVSGSYNSYLADRTWIEPYGDKPLASSSYGDLQANMNKYLLRPTPVGGDGPGLLCDSAPILPLTDDAAAVDAKITNLQAVGSTNVEEGVAWGWRVLSSGEPFTGGRPASDPKNVKAIILMTDGENTYYAQSNENRSLYGSHGYSAEEHIFEETSQSKTHTNANFTLAMEARTRKICENAKNDGRRPMVDVNGKQLNDAKGAVTSDGVLIYTIAFDIPAAIAPRIKQVLTDCASYKTQDMRNTALPYASKTKYYYPVKDEAALKAAFTEIMASLTKMRIAE